jgi:hypothetical protein
MTDHIVNMNTAQTRFDLATLLAEWRGFLENQCGYEKVDPSLVAVLVFEHGKLFHEVIHDEGLCWDDITGNFIVPGHVMTATGGFPYSLEALDLIWTDCFDGVNERFDEIEERLHQEREHGLV